MTGRAAFERGALGIVAFEVVGVDLDLRDDGGGARGARSPSRSPGPRRRRVSQPSPMFVARPGMIMLSLAPKCMSLAPMTSPPLLIDAKSMARRGAGDARPVDGDVAVDAQPRDAAIGKDVQPHVRPRRTSSTGRKLSLSPRSAVFGTSVDPRRPFGRADGRRRRACAVDRVDRAVRRVVAGEVAACRR